MMAAAKPPDLAWLLIVVVVGVGLLVSAHLTRTALEETALER
jgi:hypothetical protein